MKIRLFLILLLTILGIDACPTCMGRITQSSPPFFSDEFYKPTSDNMDEVYQAILELQQDMVLTTTNAPQKEQK